MEITTKAFLKAVPLLAACLVAGCATQETLTERNFGDSVRNMIRVQTYDPSTLSNPDSTPLDGVDGQKLEGAVEAYRSPESAGSAESVREDIVVSVGGGQ